MNVQSRISAYIRQMGIKQTVICEKTGIRVDAMNQIMNGKRKLSADEYELICRALEKTPNDFMTVEVRSDT